MIDLLPSFELQNKSNYNIIYYRENVFSDEDIARTKEMVETHYTFSKGRTGVAELGTSTDSYETNNRDIAYVVPADHSKWLYEKLAPFALEANQEYFNFDIQIVTDPIHYVIYPPDGGHLDWHMDVGIGGVNRRKLAMTVELSDPSEYEGGEFEIWFGGKKPVYLPRKKGDLAVFPAFCLHRVKPITRGRRICLVYWTGSVIPYR